MHLPRLAARRRFALWFLACSSWTVSASTGPELVAADPHPLVIESGAGISGSGTSLQEVDAEGLWHDDRRPPAHPSAGMLPAREPCACGQCAVPTRGPVYRFLDQVAGGIEHVFGLDRTSGHAPHRCDDGCDAMRGAALAGREVEALPRPVPESSDDRPTVPPQPPQPRVEPAAPRELPTPRARDQQVNPFEDEAAWVPGRNPTIRRSAYFE